MRSHVVRVLDRLCIHIQEQLADEPALLHVTGHVNVVSCNEYLRDRRNLEHLIVAAVLAPHVFRGGHKSIERVRKD